MTQAEFFQALDSLGMPVAYGRFAKPTNPPFIAYQMAGDSDLKADNKHFYNIDNGTIELYTGTKDLEKEKLIEDKLEETGIPYSRLSEGWIPEEKMLRVIWQFQLME